MKINRIGNTKASVTEISFGCSSLGNLYRKIDDDTANSVLQYAWDRGIRYFDTAPHYGRGLSELRLGHFLRHYNRSDYTISTKVGRVLSPGPYLPEADGFIEPLPNTVHYDYSGDGIETAFEQSCQRLGTNRIDILYVHDIGHYTHGAETDRHMDDLMRTGLDRLTQLRAKGRISAYGLGVNENEVCLDVMAEADIDVILLAGRLTLLDRSAQKELVPLCQKKGTTLVLGGVFNSGILATGPKPGVTFDYKPAAPDIIEKAATLQSQAEAAGTTLASAALHFAISQPQVVSTLIGTAQIPSLKRNLDTIAEPLPQKARLILQ